MGTAGPTTAGDRTGPNCSRPPAGSQRTGSAPAAITPGGEPLAAERLAVNRAKIVHETFEGEVIIVNLESGTYYSLIETGLEVWCAVEQGLSRRSLVEALARHHGAERGVVAASVEPFIDELLGEEMIVLEAGDGGPEPELKLE